MFQQSITGIAQSSEEAVRREYKLLPTIQLEKVGELWYVLAQGEKIEVSKWAEQATKKEIEQ